METIAALREVVLKISEDNATFLNSLSARLDHLITENATWREEANKTIQANLEAVQALLSNGVHSHEHDHAANHAKLAQSLSFSFTNEAQPESSFCIWMNSLDHPSAPGTYSIKARNAPEGEFEVTEAPQEIEEFLITKYIEADLASNQWHYVTVYRLSAEPVDETSVPIQ